MAHKVGVASTLATVASIFFVSGLIVLSGGEHASGKIRNTNERRK